MDNIAIIKLLELVGIYISILFRPDLNKSGYLTKSFVVCIEVWDDVKQLDQFYMEEQFKTFEEAMKAAARKGIETFNKKREI
jgi:quinol monooxygenase YgiN